MKRLFIATLSTLVLAAAAPSYAQEISAANQNTNPDSVQITPFNLVYHGYQGYFLEQGIPSNGAFSSAVDAREIKAIDLVKSAIAHGRLSQDTLNNTEYIEAVQSQLDGFKY